jgi:hypothetical protein
MPMSGPERQRRYRERHHDDLALSHSTCALPVRDQLDRLTWHCGISLTKLRSFRPQPSAVLRRS